MTNIHWARFLISNFLLISKILLTRFYSHTHTVSTILCVGACLDLQDAHLCFSSPQIALWHFCPFVLPGLATAMPPPLPFPFLKTGSSMPLPTMLSLHPYIKKQQGRIRDKRILPWEDQCLRMTQFLD